MASDSSISKSVKTFFLKEKKKKKRKERKKGKKASVVVKCL